MSTHSLSTSRRDLLTGRALQHALARSNDALAEALVNARGEPEPRSFDTVRLETRAMACPWCVILDPGRPEAVMAASDALSLVHGVEEWLTVYRTESLVSRINRDAEHAPQPAGPELSALLTRCIALWTGTGGAFDVAVRSLILLWRRCRQAGRVPNEAEVAAARDSSGLQHVRLDAASQTITFDRSGVGLDFGAVGKGYAADRAAACLVAAGVNDFVLHGGHSSVLARGAHHGQGGWPIGIRDPLFTERRYATLLLKDQALGTSGSNVQYYRHNGRRYGHLLDPRTGWPADALLSATVVAPTAEEADALSTAFYVMGLEKAVAWCHNRPEIGALLVPVPSPSGRLTPVVCNIPDEVLFVAGDEA